MSIKEEDGEISERYSHSLNQSLFLDLGRATSKRNLTITDETNQDDN